MWTLRIASVMAGLLLLSGCSSLHNREHQDRQRIAALEREVAMLQCSHYWAPDGSVRHSSAANFVSCFNEWKRTGVVP